MSLAVEAVLLAYESLRSALVKEREFLEDVRERVGLDVAIYYLDGVIAKFRKEALVEK